MSSLFTAANLAVTPIENGDAGIILRRDGSFQVFSTGEIDENAMTPRQQEQGELLLLFALVIKMPQVQTLLRNILEQIPQNAVNVDVGLKN